MRTECLTESDIRLIRRLVQVAKNCPEFYERTYTVPLAAKLERAVAIAITYEDRASADVRGALEART